MKSLDFQRSDPYICDVCNQPGLGRDMVMHYTNPEIIDYGAHKHCYTAKLEAGVIADDDWYQLET